MHNSQILASLVLASGLLGTSVGAMAQSNGQSSSGQSSGGQSSSSQSALPAAPSPAPPAKDKSKPGTAPAPSRDANGASAPDSAQNASPSPPPQPAKKPSTAEDNPFPEDISAKAAAAAKTGDSATSGAASTTTSSPDQRQAQGSSSRDNTDQLGLDDPARKQLKLESPDGTTDIYDPKRATEDVRVGKFYLQTGYFKGAYERFKDATTFDHENVDAVFYLAEAARKLNLGKEAEQNYQIYLAAVPDGPSAKAARKALGELGSSSKP